MNKVNKFFLIILLIYQSNFILASEVISPPPSTELQRSILPLKKYSFHFKQHQIKFKIKHIDKTQGKIIQGILPKGTIVQDINTNHTLVLDKQLIVKAFIPHFDQKFAFILDRKGKQSFRTQTKEIVDLSADLDIMPTPKHYIEYDGKKLRINHFDRALKLTTSFKTQLGIMKSDLLASLSTQSNAITSGFTLQQEISSLPIRIVTLLDYGSYSLKDKLNNSTISYWKYGLGIRYQLNFLTLPTFVQLSFLGDINYSLQNTNGQMALNSNSIRLTLERIKQTKYLDIIYGLSIAKEELSILQNTLQPLPTNEHSSYLILASLGVNFDYQL